MIGIVPREKNEGATHKTEFADRGAAGSGRRVNGSLAETVLCIACGESDWW